MGVVQVSLFGERIGVPENAFVNVFGYDVSASLSQATLDSFVTAWSLAVLPKLQAITSSTVQWTKMVAYDRSGFGTEFEHLFTTPPTGSVSGECLPYFVAWGFQYVRAIAGQRSGAKRFPGVTESSQNEGVPTGSVATALPVLANALDDTITDGATSWVPVILHKTGSHTADGHQLQSVIFKRCTTQNSRKR